MTVGADEMEGMINLPEDDVAFPLEGAREKKSSDKLVPALGAEPFCTEGGIREMEESWLEAARLDDPSPVDLVCTSVLVFEAGNAVDFVGGGSMLSNTLFPFPVVLGRLAGRGASSSSAGLGRSTVNLTGFLFVVG